MSSKYAHYRYLAAALLIASADRVLKHLVVTGVDPGASIRVTRFLSITFLKNTGMAFSILSGNNFLLAAVNIALAAFLLYLVMTPAGRRKSCELAAYALVLGGALSNLWDRIFFGGVIDYIDVGFWPVFNLADASISAGAVVLILGIFPIGLKGFRRVP